MEEVVMLLMVVGDAVSSFFIHLFGLNCYVEKKTLKYRPRVGRRRK